MPGITERLAKRTLDVVGASVLLIVTLPMIVLCALITAVIMRAWPFFTQDRVGKDGEIFRFLKIRTLPPSAPKYAAKHDLVTVEAPKFSLLLRRLHLDELPQLLLVLAGKMSLVGPRPEMASLYDRYDPSFGELRVQARPGCTGLWQISVHNEGLICEAEEFDRTYLARPSIRLDLWILWRTALIAVPGGDRRIHSVDDVPSWVCRTRQLPAPVAVEA